MSSELTADNPRLALMLAGNAMMENLSRESLIAFSDCLEDESATYFLHWLVQNQQAVGDDQGFCNDVLSALKEAGDQRIARIADRGIERSNEPRAQALLEMALFGGIVCAIVMACRVKKIKIGELVDVEFGKEADAAKVLEAAGSKINPVG